MKLAIIAGGKGERLGLTSMPKPMLSIGGKPLLEHQINLAKQYGIEEIFILSGHLSEVIVNYLGDGSAFGVRITHLVEQYPLGTAGAIKQLEGRIGERFLVFYGDVLLDIDIDKFVKFDALSPSLATIIVHPNDHPSDSDLVETNEEKEVIAFHPKPHNEDEYYNNLVSAAVYILSNDILKYIPKDTPTDFGKDIFPAILRAGEKIRAYRTSEYIKDVGTIERLEEIRKDFTAGKVERFSKTRPAIFMDRDGTLIEDVNLLHKKEDLKLFPYAASSLKKINESDYLCFLVTNQSVVARNMCDLSTITEMHKKLETMLGRNGAFLNGIYFCPHHPDKGYPDENSAFKIDCECRKPKVGLIRQAAEEYNVSVEASWFIGDGTTDIQTGINAGMKTVLLRTGEGGKDAKYEVLPDFAFDDLREAVDFILCKKKKYDDLSKDIGNRISERSKSPLIITIGGQARSGKTTFVKCLSDYLFKIGVSHRVIGLDHWLVGVGERQDTMTVRERYHYKRVEEDFEKLLNHGTIRMQRYDPYSRAIVKEQEVSLRHESCIIVEGVPALDIERLRDLSRIKVYVEIDEETRRERFISFYKWKGLSEGEIQDLYSRRLMDEAVVIDETKKYADLIVRT
jgi:histidinol-phosphate phosphatase family protein